MSASFDESMKSRILDELEREKGRLECEKLRAEIAQLNFAWWKRPAYFWQIFDVQSIVERSEIF
jgi:hypothetical protein